MTTPDLPESHVEVDWNSWKRPAEGDVRSPCPALNALANHQILPHDGKNISKAQTVQALTSAFNLESSVASVFAAGAVAANPDHHAHTFDLDHVSKHGFIEHDTSLSREDVAFGSNEAFSKERFGEWFGALKAWSLEDATKPKENKGEGKELATTTWASASRARYQRVIESKMRHETSGKEWNYGLKEAVLSYGESALYLNLLGKDGKVPVEWVRILFEEERFPYSEGWRKPAEFTQAMMNHAFVEMIKANEHKAEEARVIGMGTIEGLEKAVLSLIKVPSPSMCVLM